MATAPKLEYNRGDTRQYGVQFFEDDEITPVNITGGTVTLTINANKQPVDNAAKLFQVSKSVFTGPKDVAASGIAYLRVEHADGQNWVPGKYYYDFQLVEASGDYTSSKRGIFMVLPDITR